MTYSLIAAFDSAASLPTRLFTYVTSDTGFLLFMADAALYSFLFTSIILTIVMMIAQPRNLLDVSLTLRQAALSVVIGIGLIVRWRGDKLPIWFITLELLILSIVGILVIAAVLREYFFFYWNGRRK